MNCGHEEELKLLRDVVMTQAETIKDLIQFIKNHMDGPKPGSGDLIMEEPLGKADDCLHWSAIK